MPQVYKKEYNEILELLKLIPSYDYLKIPSEKIEFFKKHAVKDYDSTIKSTNKLNFSRGTYVIFTKLYRDYIATEEEKSKIDEILMLNEQKKIKELKVNDLFSDKTKNNKTQNNLPIVKNDNISLLKRIMNKIRKFFQKK